VLPIDQHALGCQLPPGEQERTVVGAESSGGSIHVRRHRKLSHLEAEEGGAATILCS
jgi:hypothetical protein